MNEIYDFYIKYTKKNEKKNFHKGLANIIKFVK